jgi:hypothetical protein
MLTTRKPAMPIDKSFMFPSIVSTQSSYDTLTAVGSKVGYFDALKGIISSKRLATESKMSTSLAVAAISSTQTASTLAESASVDCESEASSPKGHRNPQSEPVKQESVQDSGFTTDEHSAEPIKANFETQLPDVQKTRVLKQDENEERTSLQPQKMKIRYLVDYKAEVDDKSNDPPQMGSPTVELIVQDRKISDLSAAPISKMTVEKPSCLSADSFGTNHVWIPTRRTPQEPDGMKLQHKTNAKPSQIHTFENLQLPTKRHFNFNPTMEAFKPDLGLVAQFEERAKSKGLNVVHQFPA